MNQKRPWAFRLSLPNILLLISALVMNVFGKWISDCFSLPFWLDTIGTIFAAGILGPLAGGLVGGISGCVNAVLASVTVVYAITGILVGIVIGIFYPGDASDLFRVLCAGAIAAISAVLVSTPINIVYYGGYTRNLWGDALIDMLLQSGNSRVFSSILGEALVDILIKLFLCFLLPGLQRYGAGFIRLRKKGDAYEKKIHILFFSVFRGVWVQQHGFC